MKPGHKTSRVGVIKSNGSFLGANNPGEKMLTLARDWATEQDCYEVFFDWDNYLIKVTQSDVTGAGTLLPLRETLRKHQEPKGLISLLTGWLRSRRRGRK